MGGRGRKFSLVSSKWFCHRQPTNVFIVTKLNLLPFPALVLLSGKRVTFPFLFTLAGVWRFADWIHSEVLGRPFGWWIHNRRRLPSAGLTAEDRAQCLNQKLQRCPLLVSISSSCTVPLFPQACIIIMIILCSFLLLVQSPILFIFFRGQCE